MKINIITDTTATLSLEFIEKENIKVLPIYYTLENKEFKEMDPSTYDKFYKKIINSKNFPKTSQPPLGDIINCFKESLEEDPDVVLVLPISEKLSGTYSSCILAKDLVNDEKIRILNIKTTTLNLKRIIEYLVEIRKLNLSLDEILKRINLFRVSQSIYFIPENLEYLKRGGRISKFSASVGNILNIKPILSVLDDGSLGMISKTRGFNKAISKIKSFIDSNVKYISIAYIYKKENAEKLYNELKLEYPNVKILLEEISPSIGCHTGPGTVGILFGTYYDLSVKTI